MSIAKFHADWMNLIEKSGPFLSIPVLKKVFPQGLDAHDPEHFRLLRQVHEEWDDNQRGDKPDPAIHTQWIKWVLRNTLELEEVLIEGQDIPQTLKAEIEEPQHRETLRPDMVVLGPDKKARLLIQMYPLKQKLGRIVEGKPWKASPDTRMTQLLRDSGVPLGLVTNGDQWMVVYAPPSETSGYASWYSTLWLEEQKTLAAFRTLLSLHRFFGVPDDQMLVPMLAESAAHQQEVTDQLGSQVRSAVEILIQSLDRADQDYGRELLADVPEEVLYEAALTVMMRLVFLFCAEERELLLLGDQLFDQHYAVSTLVAQLQNTADQHGEEILERRLDAWCRLLSTFRAVYGGVKHDRMHLPAYSGNLFDPDRFPFLEGRKSDTSWKDTEASPLPINNRTVLHLLRSLQYLELHGEAQRLSFRALDIEQIGHVYEGLLDHTAKRSTEPVLGLIGKHEPETPLSVLEEQRAKGDESFYAFLKKETGSTRKWANSLDQELDTEQSNRLRSACGNDEALFERVLPYAKLIRIDTFDRPVVVRQGSVYVTAGTDRRSSGTHYTPRSLTEPIVQYTLEPLVYEGPAEGTPKDQWKLKSPKELLDLKICDMACGSGAFLVQAARYMAERLLEAWEAVEKDATGAMKITPFGEPSTGEADEQLIPDDSHERVVYARRIVAQCCLYGVDVNPLATEMAKLSLWLLTLAKDKPFTFLDHSIRCGDSLIGLHDIEQLRHFNLKPDADDAVLFGGPFEEAVEQAIELRLKLEDMPANTVEDVKAQEKLLKEADDKIARLRCSADLLVAGEFWGGNAADKQERVRHAAVVSGHYVEHGPTEEFEEKAEKERRGQKMFHWPLEFPEVVLKREGFDAFVCNPPFMGGKKISPSLGDSYLNYLKNRWSHASGSADLCANFFLQSMEMLNKCGTFGLIATNTIAQGDTRELGLDYITASGTTLFRATPSQTWPGLASVFVSVVHAANQEWHGARVLNDASVPNITPLLDSADTADMPFRLASNASLCGQGAIIFGDGFTLTPEEAQQLIEHDATNRDVVHPYLGGKELYNDSEQRPQRWVINFFGWPLEEAREYTQCFSRIEELVLPLRKEVKRKAYRERWWQYAERQAKLLDRTSQLGRVLVKAKTSKTWAFSFIEPNVVYSTAIIGFVMDEMWHFANMQTTIHQVWAERYASSLKNDMAYTPTDCFENFPMIGPEAHVSDAGEAYYMNRQNLMLIRQEGLTKTYNRFHDADESSADIQKLRDLHVNVDYAVAAAYGWDDLELGHGFHETKQGVRSTISGAARREVLQRLLKLNHERYAEEVKQGLHDKKKKGKAKAKTGRKKKAASQRPLFPTDEN